MAEFTTKALVLRRANYAEADRMVTLLTPEQGRVDAIARGCRRSKSPLMNATEPFTYGEFLLFTRADRTEIRQCLIQENHYALRSDLERLTHGAYWLRLLDAVAAPGTDCRELLPMALRSLAYLSYSTVDAGIWTLAFHLKLAALSGFSPRTHVCGVCGRDLVENVGFDAGLGGGVCLDCCPSAEPMSEYTQRILFKTPRAPFQNIPLLESRPEWREAARLMQGYFATQIPMDERYLPPLPQSANNMKNV